MTVQELIDKLHAVDPKKEIEFECAIGHSNGAGCFSCQLEDICELTYKVIIGISNEH